jgi:uncharacterized membrane protein YphA (DoxX/SURF4 family)
MKELLKLYSVDIATLMIRLTTGIISFVNGIQNFYETKQAFGSIEKDTTLIISLVFASIFYCVQSLLSIALIMGLATRKIALFLIVILVITFLIYSTVLSYPDIQSTDDLSLKLLLVSSFFTLLILGGGRWSIDNLKNGD